MAALLNRSKLIRSKALKKARMESILQAGLRAFQRFSYAEVTLDSIRKLANVPEGKPELYFGSREELFLRVLSRQSRIWSEAFESRLQKTKEPLTTDRLAATLVDGFQEQPEFFHLRGLLPMVLENIIDIGAVTIFFSAVDGHLRRCGEILNRRWPTLSTQDSVRLLILFQTYASSLYHLADPSRAMSRLSAAENAEGVSIDPNVELVRLTEGLVHRYTR